MKKVLCIFIAALLSVTMVACNSQGADNAVTDLAKIVIQTVDDYLDFKITGDEAKDRLNRLSDRLSDMTFDDIQDEELKRDMTSKKNLVDIYILSFNISITSKKDSEVLEDRNELAERFQLKPRK